MQTAGESNGAAALPTEGALKNGPPDGALAQQIIEQVGSRSQSFQFSSKGFKLFQGLRFSFDEAGEPVLHMLLGEHPCAIPLRQVQQEFNVQPGSDDDALLTIVAKSLRYVKEIRPGDSIPRELLDGSASWNVEEKHRAVAKARLWVQVSSWVTGSEQVVVDAEMLVQLAEDPATKERVQTAFADIAEKLGIGRTRKQEIIDRLELVARELCYIEALRDRFLCVLMIRDKLRAFLQSYRRDRFMAEEISQVQRLAGRAVAEFEGIFLEIDGMTGEVIALLRNIKTQIEFIRDKRDDLHFRLMAWDDIIAKWLAQGIERSEAAEASIRALYQFLAPRYATQSQWQLASRKK